MPGRVQTSAPGSTELGSPRAVAQVVLMENVWSLLRAMAPRAA